MNELNSAADAVSSDLGEDKDSEQKGDKKPYHHGNLREALLENAVLRIREHGVEKLSLRALAKDVGVSQTALYRHFKDKNHLLVALAAEAFEELAELTDKASSNQLSAADALTETGKSYIAYAESHPEKYKLMFGPIIRSRGTFEDLGCAGEKAYQVIFSVIERGIASGEFINVSPRVLANSCWAMVHGISSLIIDGFFHQENNEKDHKIDCPTGHGEVPSMEEFINALLSICNRGVETR